MSSLRIAISSPNAASWSETFIKAHMDLLPGVELVLVDGDLPTRLLSGEPLVKPSLGNRLKAKVTTPVPFKDRLTDAIADRLRSNAIDVVLAEYGVAASAILPACQKADVPLVAHFHGYDAFRDDALLKVDNYKELFEGAAGLIAVSCEMEQQLLTLGAAREKVHYNCYGVVVPSVDESNVKVSERPAHFMGIGRFVDKKMPILTILAFKKALESHPDIQLTIAGDGLLYGASRALVRTYGLEGSVHLPGKMAHADVLDLFRSCRGFVQHSIVSLNNDHEGTPLAVLEAMAAGVPVVATCHAGIQDQVIHGERGLLSAEFDIDAMAANIVRIAEDPGLAERLGNAARAHITENLQQHQSIERLHAILKQCASQ